MPTYRQLDEREIADTLAQLRERIARQFPEANLVRLCDQLMEVSREASECVAWLRRPNWVLRGVAGAAITGLVVLLGLVVRLSVNASAEMTLSDLVQTIEAAVNDAVFFGIAVYFLTTIETRAKRRRALSVLHELRSMAHIVDMHQLTKDPERLSTVAGAEESESGEGRRRTTGADLSRYLDFCSELLSLIAKIAALMVQHFNDGVVLAGVNEVESLTTGLSGKIWQKITILERDGSKTRKP